MIIICDVVCQVGVFVVMVFWVFNNSMLVSVDMCEVVMKVVSELDYRLNVNVQVLVIQVSDIIGVVVMDVFDVFFGVLVKVVDLVVQQYQKYVLIGNSYYEVEKECYVIEVLICQCCNVLIVYLKVLSDDELV